MSSGKYVPPSKRPGYVPPPTSDLPPINGRYQPSSISREDLTRLFTHPQNSTLTFFSYPSVGAPSLRLDVSEPDGIAPPEDSPPAQTHPLNHLLSYVCLFPKAHPAWEPDGEIWTHTSAEKLIEDSEGAKANFGRPVPIFGPGKGRDRLTSIGWWVMENLEIIEPQSEELKRMLQVKENAKGYNRTGRTASAWALALGQTWVKLRFKRAPSSSRHYTELKDITSLRRGVNGEVEMYMLQIGGLRDEIDVLESVKEERREI